MSDMQRAVKVLREDSVFVGNNEVQEELIALMEVVDRWQSAEGKLYEGFHKKTSHPVFDANEALARAILGEDKL